MSSFVYLQAFKVRFARPLHPLVSSHYFSKYFLRLDIMHILDLKGVIAIAAGSLLKGLVDNRQSLGPRQEARLDALNTKMARFQEGTTEHRMPAFRVADLTTDGWHVIGSKLIKAANTRALVPFLKALAIEYHSAHGAYHSSVRKVFIALDDIERIFYSSEMFLTDQCKAELVSLFNKLGRHWQFLRHECKELGINAWKVSPKLHYAVAHIPEQARLINPRFVHNYGEESLVGRITKIWAASTNGPYQNTGQKTALARYLVGLIIRLTSPSPV